QHQPEKLTPGVSTRAGYRDSDRHMNDYAYNCEIIQQFLPASSGNTRMSAGHWGATRPGGVGQERKTAPWVWAAAVMAASRAAVASAAVRVRSGARRRSAKARERFPSPIWSPT